MLALDVRRGVESIVEMCFWWSNEVRGEGKVGKSGGRRTLIIIVTSGLTRESWKVWIRWQRSGMHVSKYR